MATPFDARRHSLPLALLALGLGSAGFLGGRAIGASIVAPSPAAPVSGLTTAELMAAKANANAAIVRSAHALDTGRVRDEPQFLSPYAHYRMEEYLRQIHDEAGADVRISVVRGVPDGDLDAFALGQMRTLGVGADVGGRGLLIAYDLESRRMRIEIGPGLEGVVTDGFAGYLMREHAAPFFNTGTSELGLRTTLFMIHRRIREAALGRAYDPRVARVIADKRRLSAGAGASRNMGGTASGFIGRPSTPDERLRFAPQPTVAGTFARYIEWLVEGNFQTDVTLFTPASLSFLSRQRWTSAFDNYILMGEYGQEYVIDERGDVAMLIFTSTPFISPHFFRRTPEGWQVDLAAELALTTEYAGGRYTWGMNRGSDVYSHTFADRIIKKRGYLRLRGGDNRPLPVMVKRD